MQEVVHLLRTIANKLDSIEGEICRTREEVCYIQYEILQLRNEIQYLRGEGKDSTIASLNKKLDELIETEGAEEEEEVY